MIMLIWIEIIENNNKKSTNKYIDNINYQKENAKKDSFYKIRCGSL